MWSARNRYVISMIGVFAGVLGTACGAAAAPIPVATSVPTAISSPSPSGPVLTGGEGFTWTIEDVDSGTKPALALSSNGVPHIAYMLESQSGFVKNAVRGDSSWDITTVAEGYFYGPLDLAIGADDVPQISYHDHQDSSFQPDKGDAIYAFLQDGQWKVEAIFHPGHDGWDNRITVDSQNRPHISAINPLEFEGNGLQYFALSDAGTWLVEEVGTGPITYKYATSIAIDPQGRPHITYFDQRDNDLALASKGDSGWSISTVDAEVETMRDAVQQELEAQQIYTESARVTVESLEVLGQIRAKLADDPLSPESNPLSESADDDQLIVEQPEDSQPGDSHLGNLSDDQLKAWLD